MLSKILSFLLFSILLVLVSAGSNSTSTNSTSSKQRASAGSNVECAVSTTQSLLTCENGLVTCNATTNFTGEGTNQYRSFALGFVPNQEKVDLPELVKFYLYPRVDQNYYTNYTVQIGFRFHRFSVYYSPHMFDDGFRVSNLSCYSKLVQLFRSKKEDRSIQVKTDQYGVQNTTVFGNLILF